MRNAPRPLLAAVLFCGTTLPFGGACRAPRQESRPQPPQYAPIATIKDIMLSIVDPSADVVWESVATLVTASGTEERVPRTDEDWTTVRHGAVRLAEATNLLMIPGRHVARPGETSAAPGVELAPEEMEELIDQDRDGWIRRVKALHDASLEALRAIDGRDPQALFDVGEHLEMACENCHSQYWYPNQQLPPGYGSSTR